jgi:hypothetical protein
MKLSKEFQSILIDEIKTALSYYKKAATPEEKLFYMTAIYGAAFRIMNIQFDPELAFVNHVVNAAYIQINTNLNSAKQGKGVLTFPKDVFEKLEMAFVQLISKIEQGEHTYKELETISNLAYSTSGNGYYLYQKGMLKT